MSRENVDIVKRGYELFGQGDIERLSNEIFNRDVTWCEPDTEGLPFRGERRGIDRVKREVWGQIPSFYSDFRVEPDQFIDGGDCVVVRGHYRGTARETGTRFDVPFVHLMSVRDGKVVRCDSYGDTATIIRALQGQLDVV